MSETAALLVDHVLPGVPIRQWVLTVPIELRYRLAYDGKLCGEVLAVFLRAVMGWYRKQGKALGCPGGKTGAFTVIQRASSDLRLNPHLHSLVLDGVYLDQGDDEPPLFIETPRPTDDDIRSLTETVASRVIRLLVRRGVLDETSCEPDPLGEEEPVLAGLLQASVLGTIALGERAGKRIRRVLQDPAPGQRTGALCYASRGFTLHAARSVGQEQMGKREELCRYVLRPPLANNRLKWLSKDELLLRLKTPWSDGTSHIMLSPMELIGRLAALVPPRRFNSVRYHGVLAPGSKLRSRVIPAPCEEVAQEVAPAEPEPHKLIGPARRPSRIPWAELLKRVFRADVLRCDCGGRLKLRAFIRDPFEARRYLEHVGLPGSEPVIAPARAPPQVEMVFEEG
jgi:hypothetical protein